MFNDLRWEVIVHFVFEICGIGDIRCLNFIFIVQLILQCLLVYLYIKSLYGEHFGDL